MPLELPPDFDAALAERPAARDAFWALPAEVKDEWIRWISRARGNRRRRRIGHALQRLVPPQRAAAATSEEVVAPALPPEREWWPWLLVLLVLGLALAAFLIWWFGFRDTNDTHRNTVVTAQTTVPDVVGKREADAVRTLKNARLSPLVKRAASPKAAGTVVDQLPSASSRVAAASTVTVSVSTGPPGVAVPDVKGLAAADAVRRLSQAGLKAQTNQVTATQPAGTVVSQRPASGRAPRGSTVTINVSRGSATVAVPSVVGQPRADATSAVTSAGLTPRIAIVPSTRPKGTVVAQSPAGGTKAAKGATVRLNVSNGRAPATTGTTTTVATTTTVGTTATTTTRATTTSAATGSVAVPSLVNQRLANALGSLERVGLRSSVKYQSSQRPVGTVLAQSPAAGASVPRGTRVQLNVSEGPNPGNPTPVPDVRGQDQASATSALQDAGFRVIVVQRTTGAGQSGTVVEQQPAAGTSIPTDTFVAIYVHA